MLTYQLLERRSYAPTTPLITNLSRAVAQQARKFLILAIVALLTFCPLPNLVDAASGDLDPTLGIQGEVVTDFFGSFDTLHDLALQQGGKIVATGGAASNIFGSILAIARYNSDGSLDTTFGSGGRASTDFSGNVAQDNAAVLQPDCKVVLGGVVVNNQIFDFALARFNDAGPSFDIYIQDDGSGKILQFNSVTGEYQFSNCSGLTIGGTGSLTHVGSTTTLQHNTSDRRVLARIDTSVKRATASIQLLSLRTTFTIINRNTANNTCACR